MAQQWSEQGIITAIKDLRRAKIELNSLNIEKQWTALHGAARRLFGSWGNAVVAAGIEYESVKKLSLRKWSKQMILNEIIRRSKAGLSIAGAVVSKEDNGMYTAASRHFGKKGWAKARILAGFSRIDPRPWQKWNEQNVVAAIRKLRRAGISLNTASMIADPELERLRTAGRKVFGSWAKAVRAAGLDYSKIRKMRAKGWWNKRQIIKTIRSLHRRGVRINSRTVRKTHSSLHSAAFKRFGNWAKAVEAAGLNYDDVRQIRPHGWWTKERVIKAICALERSGFRLSSKAVHSAYPDLYAAAQPRFHSWGEAVAAAGISYRAHCHVWTTKSWLRGIQGTEYRATLEKAQINAKRRRRMT